MNSILYPYLMFGGNCKEAMEFYKSIFGGELKLQTYGEANSHPDMADKIIHASLENTDVTFMASDDNPDARVAIGNNVHLSLVGNDEARLTEYFNKLAEGGKIDTPLAKQFWGDIFGMLTDKYGIHWMVNIGSMGK